MAEEDLGWPFDRDERDCGGDRRCMKHMDSSDLRGCDGIHARLLCAYDWPDEARFPRLSVEKEFAQAPLLVGGQKIGDDTSMNEFVLFAEPWWVKLLIAILFVAYFLWARDPMADACYLWPLRHRLRVRGGFGGRIPSRRGGTLAGIRRNARRYRTPFVRRLPASEDSRRTSPEFAHGRVLPGSRDHASLHCPSRGRGCTGAGPCSCEPLPSGTSCTTSVSGRRSAGRRRSPRPTCSS